MMTDPQIALGTVATTASGNKLRRFGDGWSPLKGAHWDRWTVYTDDELRANFAVISQQSPGRSEGERPCPDCDHEPEDHDTRGCRGYTPSWPRLTRCDCRRVWPK